MLEGSVGEGGPGALNFRGRGRRWKSEQRQDGSCVTGCYDATYGAQEKVNTLLSFLYTLMGLLNHPLLPFHRCTTINHPVISKNLHIIFSVIF